MPCILLLVGFANMTFTVVANLCLKGVTAMRRWTGLGARVLKIIKDPNK